MLRIYNPRLLDYLRYQYTLDDVRRLTAFLREAGTFHFPALASGLHPAAHVSHDDPSGYASIWVRDNAHVAHAHLIDGRPEAAAAVVSGLAKFLATQRKRIQAVLDGENDASDPMHRPHIRFDGHKVAEIDERWAHAQNDALGYFLWIASKLVAQKALPFDATLREVLAGMALFLEKIEYWTDEDSGHWEETRKQSSSSIGTALAGLTALEAVYDSPLLGDEPAFGKQTLTHTRLRKLVERGRETLLETLPHECANPDPTKRREADAALLFLIYPLEIVDGAAADKIIDLVVRDLRGDIGIRRYRGDSYWCADYKTKISSAEARSADYSEDLSGRDALLREGEEAQWCIFDPMLSAAYGRRYEQSRSAADLKLQTEYLNRSLGHLTSDDSRFGGLRCPESYYLENGSYVPVDQTPLLWTQGNLLTALRMMEQSLA
ncbi:MAG: phosphorylase kinase [Pirellula sp.]|nr:phosphorylase kinase [Pirellula sp.]